MTYDWLWYPVLCLVVGVLSAIVLLWPERTPDKEDTEFRQFQRSRVAQQVEEILRDVGWIEQGDTT
jgi:hypothetical protein